MNRYLLSLLLIFAGHHLLFATGESAGLMLLESPSARPAALGDAFTAGADDISAMAYNPASLGSLQRSHASFFMQRGLASDALGQLMFGIPFQKRSLGASAAYYDGGNFNMFDGQTRRTVRFQRDIVVSMGLSQKLQTMAIGIAGKYLSSELGETAKAHAFAADAGVTVPFASRWHLGLSFQNFGTKMRFGSSGEDLPTLVRGGVSYLLTSGHTKTTIFVDSNYLLKEHELDRSVGVEVAMGVLALRAGYKPSNTAQSFSVGTGFLWDSLSFDYAFGLSKALNAKHLVSLSLRFGSESMPKVEFVKIYGPAKSLVQKETLDPRREEPIINFPQERMTEGTAKPARIYAIQPGDNLAKIAKKFYGRSDLWFQIYSANKHFFADPTNIEAGQKIIIP